MSKRKAKQPNKTKKIIGIGLLLAFSFSLCACKKVQVFEHKEEYRDVETYKRTDLMDKMYYIKDGARFRTLYNPNVTNSIYHLKCSFNDIPTLYKGEVIVYKDESDNVINEIPLTRLKSIGYNFGLYNGRYENDEYIFSSSQTVEGSSGNEVFSSKNATIRILTLNEEKITPEMIKDGVLVGNGLETNTEYPITCYIGTNFYNGTITNNILSMVKMETYTLCEKEETQNGYIQFKMNNDYKSGYYYIDDIGLFRYIASEKDELKESPLDINYYEPLYSISQNTDDLIIDVNVENNDEADNPIPAVSSTYSVPISEMQTNYTFKVQYNKETLNGEKPTILLKSPKGYVYSFKESSDEDNVMAITMAVVEVGEWNVLIQNKNLEIIDVSAKPVEKEIAKKEIQKDFILEKTGCSYKARVIVNGKIFSAYISNNSTGEVSMLNPISENEYEYIYQYVTDNDFSIFVICEENSEIEEISFVDCSSYEVDVLTF